MQAETDRAIILYVRRILAVNAGNRPHPQAVVFRILDQRVSGVEPHRLVVNEPAVKLGGAVYL